MLLSSVNLKAQETPQDISPTVLLQVYKYWQGDDEQFWKYTVKYLMTDDNHWYPLAEPHIFDGTLMIFMGYMLIPLDHDSWYKNKEYHLDLLWDKNQNSKLVSYNFTSQDTWNKYNAQMELMNAVKLGDRPFQGGNSTFYAVNDINFMLVEFPPGINGDDKTYRVQISRQK
ncbi:hypothetical protein [Mucilaginibacter sp.]|uniref:hypothetical protein n=1 Tax=Mucilaginibacter sp. TaxID=1882438 RepID=UPI002852B8B9|nr:hypothetical protein [Mucilaginibacter sp.]